MSSYLTGRMRMLLCMCTQKMTGVPHAYTDNAHARNGLETSHWAVLQALWCSSSCQSCRFFYLTRKHAIRLPNPPQMHNKGNFVISLRYLLLEI